MGGARKLADTCNSTGVNLEMCLQGVKVEDQKETHLSTIKVNDPVSVCQCGR